MFSNDNGYSLSDIAAVSGNNNDGWGGNGASWWIIILFLFAFCGWGNNGFGNNNGGGSALTRGELCQDMNFSDLENSVRGVNTGLCDGFYAMNTGMLNGFAGIDNAVCTLGYQQQQGINSVLMNGLQNTNALQSQIQNCCCENREAISNIRYQMATDTCAIQNSIQNTTRDIIDNQNCNTRSILDFLTNDKIATLQAENQNLKFAASQQAQNNYLVNALRPSPVPAFSVPAPYQYTNCGCNYNGFNA